MDSHDNADKKVALDQTIMMSKVEDGDVTRDTLEETTVIHSLKSLTEPTKGAQEPMAPKQKKRDWSFYVIICCLIAIAIPSIWLGFVSIKARMERGKPMHGTRFDGDHNPAITQDDLSAISASVSALEAVSQAHVTLVTSTVRVYVIVNEGVDKGAYPGLAENIQSIVYERLPEATYFEIKPDDKKMYDYDIAILSAWKKPKGDDTPWIYYSLVKGSAAKEAQGQFLSDAASEALVKDLLEAQEALDNPKEEAGDA